jgi:hypothetical protein
MGSGCGRGLAARRFGGQGSDGWGVGVCRGEDMDKPVERTDFGVSEGQGAPERGEKGDKDDTGSKEHRDGAQA